MKREFLQNLKVGEQALPKEIVDAIMEENGRDINAAKAAAVKPYGDYETLRQENESLKALQSQNQAEGKTAQQWKDAYDQAVSEHQKQLDGVVFQYQLDAAISACGGRNTRAICALLDLDALRNSQDRQAAMETALQSLKAEESYLFGAQTPPPYARGTDARQRAKDTAPTDLAGALREKFERK